MTYSPDAPEITGYFWHRDTPETTREARAHRSVDRKERIVKIIKDQGTNALIVFDPDFPLETKAAWNFGGEFAGPIKPPEAA